MSNILALRPKETTAALAKASTDDIALLLGKEMGFSLEMEQQGHMIKALNDPNNFMKERNTEIYKILQEAAKVYKSSLTQTADVLPEKTANEIALKEAQAIYNSRMNLLQLYNPAYSTLITDSINKYGQKEDKLKLVTEVANNEATYGGVDEKYLKQYYKDRRNKKKGKN